MNTTAAGANVMGNVANYPVAVVLNHAPTMPHGRPCLWCPAVCLSCRS